MTTTQHPLTDETRDRLAAYITHGTIDCSSEEGRYDSLTEDDARRIIDSLWGPMTEAAFDAGREHEREHATQGRTAEITDEMVKAGHAAALGRSMGDPATYRRIIAAALDVATPTEPLARTILGTPASHGAPHHDGVQIKAGDFLVEVDGDGLAVAGIAHHQDSDGDWRTKNGRAITWAKKRADRPDAITVWPAPPPDEEVEVPAGTVFVTDVQVQGGNRFPIALLTSRGIVCNKDGDARAYHLSIVDALTLPDGTRVRRDGERANGEPRFVKTQEEEK